MTDLKKDPFVRVSQITQQCISVYVRGRLSQIPRWPMAFQVDEKGRLVKGNKLMRVIKRQTKQIIINIMEEYNFQEIILSMVKSQIGDKGFLDERGKLWINLKKGGG